MTIRIGSNIQAIAGVRQLNKTSSSLNQSFERLSSGQRINKAGDDAAGLAIADALRVDSRLTTTAQRNISDGISAINILNAGLDSQKGILFRLAELAEQSANGVYSTEQRKALDSEYQALLLEFDRIGSTTEFNGVNLLRDSSGEELVIQAGITGDDTSLLKFTKANSHRFAGVTGLVSEVVDDNTINIFDQFIARAKLFEVENEDNFEHNGNPINFQGYATLSFTDSNGENGKANLFISRIRADAGNVGELDVPLETTDTLDAYLFGELESGEESSATASDSLVYGQESLKVDFNFATKGTSASVSIDLTDTTFYSTQAGIDVRETAIGFTGVISRAASLRALDTVNNRIEDISALQGQFGAVQNRLEISHETLAVARENYKAAESQIRDADVASESSKLIRYNILQQAGAAVLAQANQQPALALSLLN